MVVGTDTRRLYLIPYRFFRHSRRSIAGSWLRVLEVILPRRIKRADHKGAGQNNLYRRRQSGRFHIAGSDNVNSTANEGTNRITALAGGAYPH